VSGPNGSRPPRRVLVIEDDPDFRFLLELALRSAENCEATFLGDGQGAVDAVRERRPDFVVVDLMLPGRSGEEVIRDLQPLRAELGFRIVAVSALAEPRFRATVAAGWYDGFLRKPFNPLALLARLESLAPGEAGSVPAAAAAPRP
jgi:two-component system response regulator MtrA